MDYKEVHLQNLNSGAVGDLFEEEFAKLLKNIADDNTDATKTRSITIKLTVKPSKDRSKADTMVAVTSNLAPLKPHESFIVLESDGRNVKAFTTDVKQLDLDQSNQENIKPFPAAVGGK